MRPQRNRRVLFPVRRVFETRLNVFLCKIRKILDDFFFAHTRRKPAEHVADSDAQAANGRFPAALARLDGDDFAVVHDAENVSP